MTLILAYRNRGITRNLQVLDANGAVITPGVNDKVRVSIGREEETAKFTVTSGTPTANGSSLTKGATNVLRIDASDLNFDAGIYSFIFDYYDHADAAEWKNVSREVFSLQSSGGILDISEVLLELGLAATVSETEMAIVQQSIRRAEASVKKHLRYDPVIRTRTEFYPLMYVNPGNVQKVWDANDTEAFLRNASGSSGTELLVQHLPVRASTPMQLWIDYDGRNGTRVGSFGASTLKVEGTDFWPNYDGVDSDGYSFCRDGLLRSGGLWPSEPGAVKITYTAGYTAEELRGQDLVVDAASILDAALIEAVRRAKHALIINQKSKVGFVAGAISSESFGSYSYSVDGSALKSLFGSINGLTAESMSLLSEYVNWGFAIGG